MKYWAWQAERVLFISFILDGCGAVTNSSGTVQPPVLDRSVFFYASMWRRYQLSDIKSNKLSQKMQTLFPKCSRCAVTWICVSLYGVYLMCTLCHGNCIVFVYIFFAPLSEIEQQPHAVYGNSISHQAVWLHFCKQSIKPSRTTVVTTTTNEVHVCHWWCCKYCGALLILRELGQGRRWDKLPQRFKYLKMKQLELSGWSRHSAMCFFVFGSESWNTQ